MTSLSSTSTPRNTPCSICLNPIERASDVQLSTLNCGHRYHETCLSGWVRDHDTCPLDRSRITSINGEPHVRPNSAAVVIENAPDAEVPAVAIIDNTSRIVTTAAVVIENAPDAEVPAVVIIDNAPRIATTENATDAVAPAAVVIENAPDTETPIAIDDARIYRERTVYARTPIERITFFACATLLEISSLTGGIYSATQLTQTHTNRDMIGLGLACGVSWFVAVVSGPVVCSLAFRENR